MSEKTLVDRLWSRDLSLWSPNGRLPDEVENRLGWINAVPWMERHCEEIQTWADSVIESGRFTRVALLGMGGSSLAAEVFHKVFGSADGYPDFTMLDSTNPGEVNRQIDDPQTTLFLVASKSGSTLETADLMAWFYAKVQQSSAHPGANFVAITDPGSGLAAQAGELGFARVFLNPADIGGRYSALSFFGLVPAALMGIDLKEVLEGVRRFIQDHGWSGAKRVERLSRLMADANNEGNHNLRICLDGGLAPMGIWIEQLVAESLGKHGQGVVPVLPLSSNRQDAAGRDLSRSTVSMGLDMNREMSWETRSEYDLGAEFMGWEMATALAASLIDVNPFDQPDVEKAKSRTREIINGSRQIDLPKELEGDGYGMCLDSDLYSEPGSALEDFLGNIQPGGYLALLAYLPMDMETSREMEDLAASLSHSSGVDVTPGWGPRYLHSTGQLHKGGPATGCFIQFVEDCEQDAKIPGRHYGFAALHRAQADGDFSVLQEIGRPIMRITIKKDRLHTLAKITKRINATR